ncbi:hypothetical protein EBR96_08085 [bacterium]|nr:hypothetical protein [bacterium]
MPILPRPLSPRIGSGLFLPRNLSIIDRSGRCFVAPGGLCASGSIGGLFRPNRRSITERVGIAVVVPDAVAGPVAGRPLAPLVFGGTTRIGLTVEKEPGGAIGGMVGGPTGTAFCGPVGTLAPAKTAWRRTRSCLDGPPTLIL